MLWSFSRLNAYYHCPYEWKRNYIDCEPGEDNFYAEFGSLCHSLLERYFKHKISAIEISQVYEKEFDKYIKHPVSPTLQDIYYQAGMEYFDNIDFPFDKYDILGVENKRTFKIDDDKFVGYIDLLIRDKQTGEITIVDHKSSTLQFTKKGEIAAKDSQRLTDYKRQLYLYSIPVIKQYGKVDYLKWNLFKTQQEYEIKWDKQEFDEAVEWAKKTLFLIKTETQFATKPNYFYCANLCSYRDNCKVFD